MGTTATGRPRNRSWPEALKREIVAASFAPGSSVSVVARQYDVNANQVFSWRKRYRDDPHPAADRPAPQLIPVMITALTYADDEHVQGHGPGPWRRRRGFKRLVIFSVYSL